ncbi:hypothetical protein EW026_g8205, partial [Hermanssonia centrifuga]
GYLDHIDGKVTAPVSPTAPIHADPKNPDPAVEKAHEEAVARYEKEVVVWKKGEVLMKQLIVNPIPDSLFMKIRGQATAHGMWTALAHDFEKKSCMVSVDLQRRLQDTRCAEKDDLRTHFLKLRDIRKSLSAMGHPPSEDDFYAIILGSLPASFDPFISAITATTSVLGTTLSAEDLMLTLSNEYDRRAIKSKGGRKDDSSADAAFSVNEKGKGKSKRNVECFNCHKKGHIKSECWAPGRGKEGQGPKGRVKGKDSVAAAKADDADDAAWMAIVEADTLDLASDAYVSSSMTPLSLDDDGNWFPDDNDAASCTSSDSMPSLDTVSETTELPDIGSDSDWSEISGTSSSEPE